jgi:hypothetical protein
MPTRKGPRAPVSGTRARSKARSPKTPPRPRKPRSVPDGAKDAPAKAAASTPVKVPEASRAKKAAPKPKAKAQPKTAPAAAEVISISRPRRRKPKPGVGGRPTALTDEARLAVLQALGAGASRKEAAGAAGVTPTSFHRWLNRGNREQMRIEEAMARGERPEPNETEEPFRELCTAVMVAESQTAVSASATLRQAMQATRSVSLVGPQGRQLITEPDWNARIRASTFYLERRVSGFQAKEYVAMDVGGTGEPIRIEVSAEDERERAREIVDVLAATGALDVLSAQQRGALPAPDDEGGS